MPKLTAAENELIQGLAVNLHGRVSMDLLKPATRAMAKRLRKKGLLSKKWHTYASLTQAGWDAVRNNR